MKHPARWLALAVAMMTVSAARADYLPKGAPEAAGARNIVLIYNGGVHHRNWQTPDFETMLAYHTAAGGQVARLFDTLLVLPLWADSGRGFCPGFGTGPSNITDWRAYRDQRLFGGDSHLHRLQQAARQVAARSRNPNERWKVILTLPYPDPTQRNFGALVPGARSLDLASVADRRTATEWYMATVIQKWVEAGFANLDLVGWYWVHEASSGPDPAFLPQVSAMVHAQGRRFFWIPYYKSAGSSKWRDYGFDVAIHQPNHFFTLSVPDSRLADASAYARQHGMGVELELDDRAIYDTEFRRRYDVYLNAGVSEGFRDGALTVWYMGGDTLVRSARGEATATRELYEKTYQFIARSGWPGDATGDRFVDMSDALMLLRIATGRAAAPAGVPMASMDVVPDGVVDLRDAAHVLRLLNGIHPAPPEGAPHP